MKKGEMDEFGWILVGALVFILIITVVWLPSRQPSPVVQPESIELNLLPGSGNIFYITINGSKEGKMENVTLVPCDLIKSWIGFDKNTFDISNSEQVKVSIMVPKGTVPGTYIGTVKISSPGGYTTLSLRINVVSISQLTTKSRAIDLNSPINAKYSIGAENIFTMKNIEILRSAFDESGQSIGIAIPKEKLYTTTGGYLNITIDKVMSEGNLIIMFNNVTLYNKKASEGTIIIPIDDSLIGTTNNLVVQAYPPPWYKFWTKTDYKMKEFTFATTYQDTMERQRYFDLSNDEVLNFKSFKLTTITRDYSKPLKEMEIKINNQPVYLKIPPLTFLNETFSKDIFGNSLYLKKDNNTISFSFESESYYNMENAFLIVYYTG
jgi:hypothetical protein